MDEGGSTAAGAMAGLEEDGKHGARGRGLGSSERNAEGEGPQV